MAEEKDVTRTKELSHKGLTVLSDKVALTNEIMCNLISNAIKFSFAGGEVKSLRKRTAMIVCCR